MASGSFKFKGHHIFIEMKPSSQSTTKLGITVTKRYGKAHERNRFKRRVREAFRLAYQKLPSSLYIHVKPFQKAKEAKMQQIQEELLSACGCACAEKNREIFPPQSHRDH